MVRDENLDFWIRHGYNVLFVGQHGVGKTSIVRDAFERNGLKWKYFSAATMDPWVDLVGVPRQLEDDQGEYLDLLRFRGLDEVEAFFFDELNRSHKKIRNAVMELIQFRTINGKPFKNLKVIWAAINPDDDETYDVEKLDPAQADRFHVKVTVPYKPDRDYFSSRYGETVARAAIAWWNELPNEMKNQVSPRRLDYALDIHSKQGDIRFTLPEQCNVAKLLTTLKHGPIQDMLQALLKKGDVAEAAAFLSNENNYQAAIGYIKKNRSMMSFFLPVLAAEKLSVLASETSSLRFMIENLQECEAYANTIRNVFKTGTDKGAVREINKAARNSPDLARCIGQTCDIMRSGNWVLGTNPEKPFFARKPKNPDYSALIMSLAGVVGAMHDSSGRYLNTVDRKKMYREVIESLPSTLSLVDADHTLRFLDNLAKRSQFGTFEKLPNVMGVVNHCIDQISKNGPMSLEQTIKKSVQKKGRLWNMIRSDQALSARLLAPNSDRASA